MCHLSAASHPKFLLSLPAGLEIEAAVVCQIDSDSLGKHERIHSYWYNLEQQSYFCIVTRIFAFYWPWRLKPASFPHRALGQLYHLSKATSGLTPTHFHFLDTAVLLLCTPSGQAVPTPCTGQWGPLLIYRPGSLIRLGKPELDSYTQPLANCSFCLQPLRYHFGCLISCGNGGYYLAILYHRLKRLKPIFCSHWLTVCSNSGQTLLLSVHSNRVFSSVRGCCFIPLATRNQIPPLICSHWPAAPSIYNPSDLVQTKELKFLASINSSTTIALLVGPRTWSFII